MIASYRPSGIASVISIALTIACSAVPAAAATPAQVDEALTKAKAWVYAKQASGTWEAAAGFGDTHGDQTGGLTALAVYALLAAGESPTDERLAPAIDYLHKTNMTGVYALALRAQVSQRLPQTADRRRLITKDANTLRGALLTKGPGRGFYGYNPADRAYSHSRGNYGVLGMWALSQTGIDVPNDYWKTVEDAWVSHQDPSGGWTYKARNETEHPLTPGMTAAGVATLFITQDHLGASRGLDCRPAPPFAPLERGMKWLTDHFDKVATDESYPRDFPYATLYGIERVGVASGLRAFGSIDWYEKGSDWLVRRQRRDGAWAEGRGAGNLDDTCFAMLFLARGRAPPVRPKLDYSGAGAAAGAGAGVGAGGAAKGAAWNARPRDAANLARFIGSAAERELNWQIVTLDAPVEHWHDAPILYVAGRDEWAPADAHRAKLKQFVEQGGMILAVADCGGRGFAASVRKLGSELFPSEFRELPAEHPIYAEQQFKREKWKTKPKVLGLSNGVRELVVLIPDGDPGRVWQTNKTGGNEPMWQLAADVFQYAVDKRNLRNRGETYLVVRDDSIKPDRSVQVARVEYGGNWDPEAGGWRRMANVMHNRHGTDLKVAATKLTSGALGNDGKGKVAHVTGTTKMNLDAAAQAELKRFVAAGGTLVIDAAGGSSAFAESAEGLLAALFPGTKPQRLPSEHPVYVTNGPPLSTVAYRPFARSAVGSEPGPRVQAVEQDGRIVAFYSREDLTAGLVGQPVDGIIGYEPKTATEIMAKILLHVATR